MWPIYLCFERIKEGTREKTVVHDTNIKFVWLSNPLTQANLGFWGQVCSWLPPVLPVGGRFWQGRNWASPELTPLVVCLKSGFLKNRFSLWKTKLIASEFLLVPEDFCSSSRCLAIPQLLLLSQTWVQGNRIDFRLLTNKLRVLLWSHLYSFHWLLTSCITPFSVSSLGMCPFWLLQSIHRASLTPHTGWC